MFLVVVNGHSKWPEVHLMDYMASSKTIQVLRRLFSHYSIPETLVSGKGPQFTSDEFGSFLKANGVKNVHSAPFHPPTKFLVVHFEQTFKHSLKSSNIIATENGCLLATVPKYPTQHNKRKPFYVVLASQIANTPGLTET